MRYLKMLIDENLDKLYDKREEVKLKTLLLKKQELELLIEKNEILKLKGSNNGREEAKKSRVKVREGHGISSSKT